MHPRLAHLAALPADWDSYGSPPIRPHLLEQADRILAATPPPTHVAPVSGGAVQLEWRANGAGIEVWCCADGISTLLVPVEHDADTWEDRDNLGEDEAIAEVRRVVAAHAAFARALAEQARGLAYLADR